MKRLFIKTYGCQMNVYDSDRMADVLAPLGYARAETPDGADMVILNTCHIREKAAEKVYSELGRLRGLREARRAEGGDMIIAVAGCVAQAEGAELGRRAPFVDLVVGPQTYHRLPAMVARLDGARAGAVLDTEFPAESKFDHLPEETAARGASAFVTIQEGCNKFCTFCVVPYTRGAEFSRPVEEIAGEVAMRVAAGAREVTLLGQNVNAYHGTGPDGGDWSLGRLVRHLADGVEGLARIRYTTSHPRDVDDDLVAAHGEVPALMPFLHLPVQSGSDRMLRAMNRRHDADFYRRVVDRLRAARPDLALSSDFIVGFPGESDDDFAATMDLVREIGFCQAYSFRYSARPGTPAADLADQVPAEVAAARLTALQDLLERQQRDFNAATVGRTLPVLVERAGRHAGQVVGRSPYNQAVHVTAPGRAIGDIVEVRVTGTTAHGLSAEIAAGESAAAATARAAGATVAAEARA